MDLPWATSPLLLQKLTHWGKIIDFVQIFKIQIYWSDFELDFDQFSNIYEKFEILKNFEFLNKTKICPSVL